MPPPGGLDANGAPEGGAEYPRGGVAGLCAHLQCRRQEVLKRCVVDTRRSTLTQTHTQAHTYTHSYLDGDWPTAKDLLDRTKAWLPTDKARDVILG